jgi:hypothetical protein
VYGGTPTKPQAVDAAASVLLEQLKDLTNWLQSTNGQTAGSAAAATNTGIENLPTIPNLFGLSAADVALDTQNFISVGARSMATAMTNYTQNADKGNGMPVDNYTIIYTALMAAAQLEYYSECIRNPGQSPNYYIDAIKAFLNNQSTTNPSDCQYDPACGSTVMPCTAPGVCGHYDFVAAQQIPNECTNKKKINQTCSATSCTGLLLALPIRSLIQAYVDYITSSPISALNAITDSIKNSISPAAAVSGLLTTAIPLYITDSTRNLSAYKGRRLPDIGDEGDPGIKLTEGMILLGLRNFSLLGLCR